jgi:hypothetical protein
MLAPSLLRRIRSKRWALLMLSLAAAVALGVACATATNNSGTFTTVATNDGGLFHQEAGNGPADSSFAANDATLSFLPLSGGDAGGDGGPCDGGGCADFPA